MPAQKHPQGEQIRIQLTDQLGVRLPDTGPRSPARSGWCPSRGSAARTESRPRRRTGPPPAPSGSGATSRASVRTVRCWELVAADQEACHCTFHVAGSALTSDLQGRAARPVQPAVASVVNARLAEPEGPDRGTRLQAAVRHYQRAIALGQAYPNLVRVYWTTWPPSTRSSGIRPRPFKHTSRPRRTAERLRIGNDWAKGERTHRYEAGLPEICQKQRLATPRTASPDLVPPEPLSCDDVVRRGVLREVACGGRAPFTRQKSQVRSLSRPPAQTPPCGSLRHRLPAARCWQGLRWPGWPAPVPLRRGGGRCRAEASLGRP